MGYGTCSLRAAQAQAWRSSQEMPQQTLLSPYPPLPAPSPGKT